jgi:hypothetical protein
MEFVEAQQKQIDRIQELTAEILKVVYEKHYRHEEVIVALDSAMMIAKIAPWP